MIYTVALSRAARDDLSKTQLRVLLLAHEHLHVLEPRPLKHTLVSRELRLDKSNVSFAISALRRMGYLIEIDRRDRVRRYVLAHPPPREDASPFVKSPTSAAA